MRNLLSSGFALALAAFLSNSTAFAQDAKKPDAGKLEATEPAETKTQESPKPKGLTRSLSQPSATTGKSMNDGQTDDPIGGLAGHAKKGSE
jgi:hypothetical protein